MRRPSCGRSSFLLGLAASFWLAGSLIWYGYFLANGQKVPSPPGPWDAAFLIAYALALGAVYVGFRRVISLRLVALDSSVLAAAALAFGAALVGHGLAKGISAASMVPILRPLLGIVMIALLASAALHRWEGLPVPVALVGAGQVFLTIGSFVYAFEAVQSDYINDRWADLGWFAGAIVSLLAASTVVLGINEPVRQLARRPAAIPNEPVGAKGVLLLAVGALTVTLAVALDGKLSGNEPVLIVGLVCGAWVGLAMAVRARAAIRELERAYQRLDRTHSELEQTQRPARGRKRRTRPRERRAAHRPRGVREPARHRRRAHGRRPARVDRAGRRRVRAAAQALPRPRTLDG